MLLAEMSMVKIIKNIFPKIFRLSFLPLYNFFFLDVMKSLKTPRDYISREPPAYDRVKKSNWATCIIRFVAQVKFNLSPVSRARCGFYPPDMLASSFMLLQYRGGKYTFCIYSIQGEYRVAHEVINFSRIKKFNLLWIFFFQLMVSNPMRSVPVPIIFILSQAVNVLRNNPKNLVRSLKPLANYVFF